MSMSPLHVRMDQVQPHPLITHLVYCHIFFSLSTSYCISRLFTGKVSDISICTVCVCVSIPLSYSFRTTIGDMFAAHAGYNGVAEVNSLIVLYPQIVNTTLNLAGCWDWYVWTCESLC